MRAGNGGGGLDARALAQHQIHLSRGQRGAGFFRGQLAQAELQAQALGQLLGSRHVQAIGRADLGASDRRRRHVGQADDQLAARTRRSKGLGRRGRRGAGQRQADRRRQGQKNADPFRQHDARLIRTGNAAGGA
ncbi:hypothetical protein WJ970_22255 [Achromobacter xylosoxidans]